jgi:hypothetical protein
MKLRSAVLALTAAAVVLAPTTALADTLSKADTSGDVLKASGPSGGAVDPTRAIGDITRTVITHGPSNVKVKVFFRDLQKVGKIVTIIPVKTDKGYRRFEIVAGPGKYYGTVTVRNAKDKKVTCKTTRTIDYAANTALLVVPRKCLSNPRWVRVGAGVLSTQDGFQTIYGDDARTNGTVGGEDPTFSNKVFR